MNNKEPSTSTLFQQVFAAADAGDFRRASELAEPANRNGLLGALADADSSLRALGAWLGSAGQAAGAKRIFSTWEFASAQEWFVARGDAAMRKDGNGIVRMGAGIELVTLGEQMVAVSCQGLPARGYYLVHVLASFPSNVGDNFYAGLEGEDGSEAIRFSNTNVSLVADGAVSVVNARVLKLYTLQVGQGQARLYVNGMLQKSKRRDADRGFDRFVMKLIGEHGPDLSGSIHGFEIQHADHPINAVFGDDAGFFTARVRDLLARNDASEIYHLLKGIDDDWLEGLEAPLLELLDEHVSQRGVQEWIYDQILARISPAKAAAWVESHRDRLPAPVLSVRDLSAQFMLTPNKRFALGALLRGKGRERFNVLNDINFDVFPGDIVGIIGPNGAGKSTLLRAIAGLMPIHHGEIVLRAQHLLLSAGIGARNELTGRENIYLAGSFMGLSTVQIDALFDEIWEFSELGRAIDKPFKYYSDGMKGRLVFSLATSVSPQLLMLDELLGAGDIKFQKKAADRMEQLLNRANAVIIVTHSMPFVAQRCNKALLVAGGRLAAYGDPKEVIAHYLNILHLGDVPGDADFNPVEMSIQQQMGGGHFDVR